MDNERSDNNNNNYSKYYFHQIRYALHLQQQQQQPPPQLSSSGIQNEEEGRNEYDTTTTTTTDQYNLKTDTTTNFHNQQQYQQTKEKQKNGGGCCVGGGGGGYFLVRNALNMEQCQNSIDTIWNFIEDTSFHHINRYDDPLTWYPKSIRKPTTATTSTTSTSSSINNNTNTKKDENENKDCCDDVAVVVEDEQEQILDDPWPIRCWKETQQWDTTTSTTTTAPSTTKNLEYNHKEWLDIFDHNGANWILWNILEYLNEKLYEQLLFYHDDDFCLDGCSRQQQQQERRKPSLQCSQEGFLFHRPLLPNLLPLQVQQSQQQLQQQIEEEESSSFKEIGNSSIGMNYWKWRNLKQQQQQHPFSEFGQDNNIIHQIKKNTQHTKDKSNQLNSKTTTNKITATTTTTNNKTTTNNRMNDIHIQEKDSIDINSTTTSKTKTNKIRSMISFEDMKHTRGYISIRQKRILAKAVAASSSSIVVSSTSTTTFEFQEINSTMKPVDNSQVSMVQEDEEMEIDRIVLQQGDVLLWNPLIVTCQVVVVAAAAAANVQYGVPLPHHHHHNDDHKFIAILYCSVQQQQNYNLLQQKQNSIAYKTRQTTSYHHHDEEGRYPMNTQNHHNKTSSVRQQDEQQQQQLYRQRQYFRNGPPVLTIRQAELAGIIPYLKNQKDELVRIQQERQQRQEKALILGVRFVEDENDDDNNNNICLTRTGEWSTFYTTIQKRIDKMFPTECIPLYLTLMNHNNNKRGGNCNNNKSMIEKTVLNGPDKYLGGMASGCGQYVYGVPGHAPRVLRINVQTNAMDYIGPHFNEIQNHAKKFKWLRGVTVPYEIMMEFADSCGTNHDDSSRSSTSLREIVQNKYPSGCCFALPCNAPNILKINPATNEVYTFGEDVIRKQHQQEVQHSVSAVTSCRTSISGWYYHGGNVSKINGWIYMIPANANQVFKFHPVTDECILIGPIFDDTLLPQNDRRSPPITAQRWFGGIVGTDQCIYGIPHNEDGVLKIDPRTDDVSIMYLDGGERLPSGQWKWHGGIRAGTKIYGFPNNADQVLVIDCKNNRIYLIGDTDNIKEPVNGCNNSNKDRLQCDLSSQPKQFIRSGRHRIPQDGKYKYLGGAVTNDERFVYLFPCDAERVLRIDVWDDTIRLVGPQLLDGENKFQNGFACAKDGCLYGIPQRAAGILRIIPNATLRKHNILTTTSHQQTKDHGNNNNHNDANVDDDDDYDHVDIIDCGDELMKVKDKFEGGVLGSDGCVYCIPLRSPIGLKIVPKTI